MNARKLLWAFRGIVYSPFFGKFGHFSYLGKPIFIQGTRNISIGNRVRIYPGARMETHGKYGKILIGDNVSIGQNIHLVSYNSSLTIGKDTTLSGNILITNMDHNYKKIGIHIMQQDYISKETRIGSNCFLGYGVAILAGTTLGNQCIVGANSVVRGSYPDYCVIVGNPAKLIKKFDTNTQRWVKIENE